MKTKQTIKIEKGIPLPRAYKNGGPKPKYPWKTMKVGDSFFSKAKGVASLAFNRNNLPDAVARFATRKDGDGTRVWRIK